MLLRGEKAWLIAHTIELLCSIPKEVEDILEAIWVELAVVSAMGGEIEIYYARRRGIHPPHLHPPAHRRGQHFAD